ncbi:asparagine synthetase B family protein [Gulosibacter molinativorax]|uniref:asparagine synthase-related protein n=1 Tax=Gulosibacter molinativorax TaxID=256821 RepID=UPI00146A0326|nr:asparagine synthase-related protein [Gulosibacter molinativorax]
MVRASERTYPQYLGKRYSTKATAFAGISTDGGTLLRWNPDGIDDSLVLKSGRWVAASAPKTASRLLNGSTTRAGTIRLDDSSYGSYAAIRGDKSTDRIVAWNTAPTLEAIHYAEDADFVYVSNRPLVIAIALAANSRRRIKVSREYLLEYLNFGFSVSGHTPFAGVMALPPRTSLSVARGKVQLIAAPTAPQTNLQEREDPRRTGADELVAALRAAVTRLLDAQPREEIQLRLSGGIDSRLLLGLLKESTATKITAVCQGDANSEEVMVASQLAALAGVELKVKTPELIDPTSIVESMRASIRESQGFIPSEALVSPYAVSDPIHQGESLAAGQWPLFKGVLERTADNALEATWRLLDSRNDDVLTPTLNAKVRGEVERWAASVPAFTNLEILYMWGRDIRSSRYLQPHAIQLDRDSEIFYPYVDSEVTAVADELPPFSRMRQISAYLAVEAVWPESLRVPLANNGRFRFEASGPVPGISDDYFEERSAKPQPYTGTVDQSAAERITDREFVTAPISSAAKYVTSHIQWRTLRRNLDPEIVQIVEESATVGEKSARGLAPADKSPRWLQLITWRLVLAVQWLEGDWIPRVKR